MRRTLRLGASTGLFAGALLFLPQPSSAQDIPTPPTARVTQAREAFALGSSLARHGQWADALTAFERSLRLRAHPVTLYNIGYCERALGRYTRARKMFRQALAARSAPPSERLPAPVATEATTYLEEIERWIVRIAVTLPAAGARIAVDGRPLEQAGPGESARVLIAGARPTGPPERAPFQRFELIADPGRRVVVVSLPGAPDTIIDRDFAPGSTPLLAVPAHEPNWSRRTAQHTFRPRQTPDYTWAILAYGVSAAGVLTGAVFGLATLQKSANLADTCPSDAACPARAQGDIDAGERYALISNVGFGVGLVGAAVGTGLWLSATPASRSTHARRTSPFRAGAGLGWATLQGSF